jgi:hypothetical protein
VPQVITLKVMRKQECVTAVDRSHPALTGFGGMPGAGSASANAANGSTGTGSAGSGAKGGSGASASGGGSKVQIEHCYRAPSSLRPVFGEAGVRDKERLYSEAEVAEALAGYAAAQGRRRAIQANRVIGFDCCRHRR